MSLLEKFSRLFASPPKTRGISQDLLEKKGHLWYFENEPYSGIASGKLNPPDEMMYAPYKDDVYTELHYDAGLLMLIQQFYDNGKLASESDYRNLDYYYDKQWFKNGNLWTENRSIVIDQKYRRGEIDGEWNTYYENGHLKEQTIHRNGKVWGKSTYYYVNGNIKYEADHENGEEKGWVREYDEDGSLNKEFYWENGKMRPKSYKHYKFEEDFQREMKNPPWK